MLFATCSNVFTDIKLVSGEPRDAAGVETLLAEPDLCIDHNI